METGACFDIDSTPTVQVAAAELPISNGIEKLATQYSNGRPNGAIALIPKRDFR